MEGSNPKPRNVERNFVLRGTQKKRQVLKIQKKYL